MKKRLLIYDEDKNYLFSLMEALVEKKIFGYEIVAYSNINNLENSSDIDILITSKVIPIDARIKLYLVEYDSKNELEIFKYQSIDKIISKIISANGLSNINVVKNNVNIRVIYSRFYPHLINIYFYEYLTKRNVVLINIDSLFLRDEAMIDFTQLIYLLESNEEKLKVTIFNLFNNYKNLIVRGGDNLLDVINYDGWAKLINIFNEIGGYTDLIIAIPFIFGFEELINISDESIYLIKRDVDKLEEDFFKTIPMFRKEVVDD